MGGQFIGFVKNAILVDLHFEGATWYLRSLLILYTLFYLFSACKYYVWIMISSIILLPLLDICGMPFMDNNVITSIPKFTSGILLYNAIGEKNTSSRALLLVLIGIVLTHYIPLFYMVVSAAVVIGLLYENNVLQKLLSNRAFLYLGYISYPLYLVHQNV